MKEAEAAEDVEVSHHRVFLLGENRWEEPSRLRGNKKESETKTTGTTKCLTCRGEGRLLCTGMYFFFPFFLLWGVEMVITVIHGKLIGMNLPFTLC